MILLRSRFYNRYILYLLVLLVFNISFDTPDTYYTQINSTYGFHDNPELNDYESYYEFVTEFVFGINNHVTEHDETDSEQVLKKIKILFYNSLPGYLFIIPLKKETILSKQLGLIKGVFNQIFLPPELK